MKVDWDLSQRSDTAAVHWPKPDLDAVEVKPEGDVRIRFPGNRELTAPGGTIGGIFMRRQGQTVQELSVNGVPQTRAAGYERALEWARQWKLPTKPLEDWYRQYAHAPPSQPPNTETSKPAEKDGFGPAVSILYSFNDEKPVIPEITFALPRRR